MQPPYICTPLQKTYHARVRQTQRSVPDIAIELLQKFGSSAPSYDGSERIYFSEKDWKRVKRHFGAWMPNKSGQLRGLYMIISAEGSIITIAHQH